MAPDPKERQGGPTLREVFGPERIDRMTTDLTPLEKLHYRPKPNRIKMDNPIELSVEIIMGIERWFAVQVRELDKGNDHDGAEGYGFDKFLAVLNRRCPGVLRAILDAGADIYV